MSDIFIPKQLKRFFLKALLIFIVWELFYLFYLGSENNLDTNLIHFVVSGAGILLNYIWQDVNIVYGGIQSYLIVLGEQRLVSVGTGCNGLETSLIFMGFILCTPAEWYHKLWFIFSGLIVLYLLNVLRVAALAYNYYYHPSSFDFNHKYTYVLVIYGCIFLLWNIWVKVFTMNFGGKNDIKP